MSNKIMTNLEFKSKLLNVMNYNNKYCWGMFGHVLTDSLIDFKKDQYPTFYSASKVAELKSLDGYFGIDCVGLIKMILWGWDGDYSRKYGGASYASNGVSDINANQMIDICDNLSYDFSKIEIGEAVWKVGHIGVYIGDGKCIEMTNSWNQNLQITALGNVGKISGFNTRNWTKHGKLPWIDYAKKEGEDMAGINIDEFIKLFNEMIDERKQVLVSEWAEDYRYWNMQNGISDGTNPRMYVERQESWVMNKKLYDKLIDDVANKVVEVIVDKLKDVK